ncbi:MAG: GNAT family N-acetyltransferase [Clostridia bacterium]|nr:GNAT family N-acetyltransferase [Clostridia bacterium]
MLINSNAAYVPQLNALWKEAFGDNDEYINLFFEMVYDSSKTFAIFNEEKIVSALYLLDINLFFEGKLYKGFYLYAAATLESQRGKGYMASLIEEAKAFAEKIGYDFIALVPGEEGLYNYYKKFGFVTSMYKGSSVFNSRDKKAEYVSTEIKKRFEFEKELSFNRLFWGEKELEYAFECLNFFGCEEFICMNEGCAFINRSDNCVAELLCKEEDYSLLCNKVLSLFFGEDVEVFSPWGENKKDFGMMYPINSDLKDCLQSDMIYMNLALD